MRVFVTVLLFFFLSVSHVKASVVINEVLANPTGADEGTEFIEIINTGSESVDLNGYKLSDKQTTYVISGLIDAGGYVAYYQSETGIKLNNSDDEEVRLMNPSNDVVDNITFGVTTEGKSWSRIPDGTGGFVNGADSTPGVENIAPPSPTPTSTPTPSPTPTNEPTPTPTLTKEPSPTSTKKPTPKVDKQVPPPNQKTKQEDLIDLDGSNDILGVNDEKEDVAVDEVRKSIENGEVTAKDGGNQKLNIPILPILFVVAGISFVLAGVYTYKMQSKNKED